MSHVYFICGLVAPLSACEAIDERVLADPPSGGPQPRARAPYVPTEEPVAPPPIVPLEPGKSPVRSTATARRCSAPADQGLAVDLMDVATQAVRRSEQLRGKGEARAAVESIEKELRQRLFMGPLGAWMWCEMGLSLEESGNWHLAEESFMNAIDIHRYYPDASFHLCRLGTGAEAGQSCKIYLALQPTGPHAAEAKALLHASERGAK